MSSSQRVSEQWQRWWWKRSFWSNLKWLEHSFFNMWSTRTNLIHSLKTHCFNCVKQSYRLRVIFYLRKFCSLNTNSMKFLMSQSNQCHKNVWIYYYYWKALLFQRQFQHSLCVWFLIQSIQLLINQCFI